MYSIVVNVHYPLKKHKYAGYGICIGIKTDGIDESMRSSSIKLHTEKVNALLDFGAKIVAIRKFTEGRKENEFGRCMP